MSQTNNVILPTPSPRGEGRGEVKITMIGASGFVGTRLIGLLKEASESSEHCESSERSERSENSEISQQYEIKNIDLEPSHFFPQYTVIGDVRRQEQMDEQLRGADVVVLLAAQHRDDVSPTSLYYDTNVEGMRVTLRAMERNNVRRIVFFSSVAVYGLDKNNPAEDHPKDPFNHYGKSKWQAEQVLQEWYESHRDWNINIIRPTVIFGERNRGNVYNLLRQISSGRFLMVGRGENRKSMAYVGNVVAFVKHLIDTKREGYNVYNYIDKPDMNMNQLVAHVSQVLGKRIPSIHFPYWLGMTGGYCFDLLAAITRRKLAISSVRVKKFCATTEFDASRALATGFQPPYTLAEGLARTLEFEFVHPHADDITFKSE